VVGRGALDLVTSSGFLSCWQMEMRAASERSQPLALALALSPGRSVLACDSVRFAVVPDRQQSSQHAAHRTATGAMGSTSSVATWYITQHRTLPPALGCRLKAQASRRQTARPVMVSFNLASVVLQSCVCSSRIGRLVFPCAGCLVEDVGYAGGQVGSESL